MVVDLTVQKSAHWIHKEMQNNKHAKHTTFRLLFVTVKKKFKESSGLGLRGRPNSDCDQSELWS